MVNFNPYLGIWYIEPYMQNSNIFTFLHILLTLIINITNLIFSVDRVISKYQLTKFQESFAHKWVWEHFRIADLIIT